MKMLILGFLAIFTALNLVQAKTIEKPELNFAIDYKALNSGEIHYSFSLRHAHEIPNDIASLDTLGILNHNNARILYNKIAYIIKKPVQVFNYQQISNLSEIQRLMPHAKVKNFQNEALKFRPKRLFGYKYKLDLEYDSEIVSTANDAAVIEAIDRARRLDGVLGQPNSTIYRHIYDFSKYSNEGLSLTRHYDLDGKATLVVTTNISSVKSTFAIESIIRPSFLKETETMVKLSR